MTQCHLILAAVMICLCCPSLVFAQLTAEENRQFFQLLSEPESKMSLDKRFKLIADALEREADPKRRIVNTYPVDLKTARIPAADGVPFLLERLALPEEISKRTVLRMLAAYSVEAKAAVPAVLEMLQENPKLRVDCITALGRLDTSNAKVAEVILEQLDAKDGNDLLTRAALRALLAMSGVVPKSATPRLAKLREHAATDIGALAHELVGKVLALERPDLEKLRVMETIAWRESADEGYAVFASIVSFGPKGDFAAPLVVGVLDANPPPYLEMVALDTLLKMRTSNPKAIGALTNRMASKNPYLRTVAHNALFGIDLKQPEAVRALAAGLRHEDRNVRFNVATVLRNWNESGRIPPAALAEMLSPLLELFAELDESVAPFHLEVYLSLLRRFGPRAAPAGEKLAKLYASPAFAKQLGGNVLVHTKILAALANIGVPESARSAVLRVLEKGPNQPDGGYAYAAAARAAATFAEPKDAVSLLLPGLQIKGPEKALMFIDWSGDGPMKPTTVRLEVLRALAKFGRDALDAAPMIKEIAENTSDASEFGVAARTEARRAYQAIAGEALPPLKGIFADGKKDLLHLDERLQVKMVLKLRAPRTQDVLKRLEQATKLTFTIDENIDTQTPAFGSLFATGMPAFIFMRQLAAAPAVQAVWEDTGDGYRLVAKSKKPKVAKGPFPPFRDDSFDLMPDDPRLQKILSFQMAEPTVPELLKLVTDNTGVKFTLEKIDTDTPVYGSVNSKSAAWLTLRNLAESPRVQGTWEKAGDGYHLRGNFVRAVVPIAKGPVTAPVVPQPGAKAPESNEPPARPRTYLYIAFGVITMIFLGGVFLLGLRLFLFRNQDAST